MILHPAGNFNPGFGVCCCTSARPRWRWSPLGRSDGEIPFRPVFVLAQRSIRCTQAARVCTTFAHVAFGWPGLADTTNEPKRLRLGQWEQVVSNR
jgi:hypothetical protein